MRSFIQFIIKKPVLVIITIFFLVFMGIYSSFYMPVDLFPNLEIPVVNIITHFIGASPEDVELFISRPIENEMKAIPGVKRVTSISVQGISQVTVQFAWGTSIIEARHLIQTHLANLRHILPSGIVPKIESIGTTLQEVCGYIFYGANLAKIRSILLRHISGRIMSIPGISSVELIGGNKQAFIIKVRIKDMLRTHICLKDIIFAIKRYNSASVLGFTDKGGREYLIRGDARIGTINNLLSIPILSKANKTIFLKEIADVYKGIVPKHYVIHGDGVPAVALIIRKQPGASTISICKKIEKLLCNLSYLLPPGTKYKKFYDQSEILLESKHEIIQDIFIGALLAIFVLYIFFGTVIPTLIVAITIPLTIIITIYVMHIFGLGFNMITMTALALAVGMIVDDAIVVAENIQRHIIGKQNDPVKASIEGTVEIAGPDTSGTFTTVVAFLPLLIITGIVSIFLKPFGFTISISLLISLALSLVLVPLMFSKIRISGKQNFLGQHILQNLKRYLKSILKFLFRHNKLIILFICGGFLLCSGLVFFLGKASLLPPIDEGAILIEYVMPPGTSIKESNKIGNILERIALLNPDVSCVYRRTGSPEVGYQVEGVNRGELLIKLKPKDKRSYNILQIMDFFKKMYSKIQGCVFLYHQPTQERIDEAFSGLPSLFGVTIYGNDTKKLCAIAKKVEDILNADPAIFNVINNTKIKAPEVYIRLKYPKLGLYGLKPDDIFDFIKAMNKGINAGIIFKQQQEIPIIIRVNPIKFNSLHYIIPTPSGLIPIKKVAYIKTCYSPSFITKINGQREVTLIADVEGNILSIARRLKKEFSNMHIPEGYSIEISGQYHILIKTALEMFISLVFAILLIYLIMLMQFNSWVQPIIILVTIPIAIIGSIIALFITKQGLNISVGMGVITLAGIAVNNAIVLIDYSNREQKFGKSVEDALISAALIRLRPILLTSLTTMSALFPTAIGTTVGSQIFKPFAITVIGGLITSTFATLIFIPMLCKLCSKYIIPNSN